MKKTNKVIHYDNLPSMFPVIQSFLIFTALSYRNAPEWLYGVFGLYYVVGFISACYKYTVQEYINLTEK